MEVKTYTTKRTVCSGCDIEDPYCLGCQGAIYDVGEPIICVGAPILNVHWHKHCHEEQAHNPQQIRK